MAFPTQAVGSAAVTAPAGGFQPVGGFDPATGQPIATSGAVATAPVVVGFDARGQPIYGAAPGAGGVAQAMPQQQGMYQPGYGNAYGAPRLPYQADPRYSRGRVRGEENPAVRVLYDRWSLGDGAYFATACGALLTVDEVVLTFTSGCGGTPLVIPVAEISEIAMNVLVGKEIGAFHIATAKGLYLACTGEMGSRENSREIVENLKKRLKLAE